MELEKRAAESEKFRVFDVDFDAVDNIKSEKFRVSDMDWKRTGGLKNKEVTPRVGKNEFSDKNGGTEQLESRVETDGRAGKVHVEVGKSTVSQYDSMLSMFDKFASNGSGGFVAEGPSKPLGYGFEIGDMVWGKVKSHPCWPGHIYSEAFASPSVRRSKREGHVLVAFFGDSSYGWFDPAELVLFDPNFAKSRQTHSRTFAKAVEEAVDEVSRRCGLGLACRCRNAYNFRPTNVQGYFAVDVADYEPGGVYSTSQIRKARDSFQPRETLAFIKQLALAPMSNDHGGIHFIKNRATVLAYRKAVFEEYDETYAQAFGYQPVRPSLGQAQDVALHLKEPSRAPLSGRLVIAEALDEGKSSAKPNKAKDRAKKDKYLFKRRDEPDELKIHQINQGRPTSSAQPVYGEDSLAATAGDYVLQKRTPLISTEPQIPAKHEQTGSIERDGASALSRDVTGKEALTIEEKPAVLKFSSHLLEEKSLLDKGKGAVVEVKEKLRSDVAVGPISRDVSGSVTDIPCTFEPSTAFKSVEGFEQPPSQMATVESQGREQVQATDGEGGSTMHSDSGAKKAKARKRSISELCNEKSVPLEKKKRKKTKKEVMSSDGTEMRLSAGKGGASVGKVAGKSVQVALAPREDIQVVVHQKKDDPASTSLLPDSTGAKKAKARKRPVGELCNEKSVPLEKKKTKKEVMSSDGTEMRVSAGKGGASVGKVAGKSVQVALAPREDIQVVVHQEKDDPASTSSLPDSIGAKKAKARKRPVGELSNEKSVPLEKKKRKKKTKKAMSSDGTEMRVSAGNGGASVGKVAGKSVEVALAPREDIQGVVHQKKVDPASTSSLPDSIGTGPIEVELPQLLSELRALALDPFRDVERSPAVIRQVFLRFRSLVYQKSLASMPPVANESNEIHASKSDLSSVKPPPKPPVVKPGDPIKGGLKRGPSDRQEEMTARKKKKINDLKLLTAEKKAAQKTPDKEMVAVMSKSVNKVESVKKTENLLSRAPDPPDPTILVMKFPPQGTLPSINELKARFARFGPLDPSGTRVFWKSSTCRVVYRHKLDAQAAYKFAVGTNNLFGNTTVRYHLREMGAVGPDSESSKVQKEDSSIAVEQRVAAPTVPQQGVQLKSCLKKSGGDEAGSSCGGGRGTPRVKFMLGGGEESSKGEQLMVGSNYNFNNNVSFGEGVASSSSMSSTSTTTHAIAMDFNTTKKFQKVIPPSPLPPILPLPPKFARPNNFEVVAPNRNTHTFTNAQNYPPKLSSPCNDKDIAPQMISLLARCNDVVANVTGLLGYVPYHPL